MGTAGDETQGEGKAWDKQQVREAAERLLARRGHARSELER